MSSKVTSGDESTKFNKMEWAEHDSNTSLSFIDNTTAFIGIYKDNKLDYGWIMNMKKIDKNNFFDFSRASFVASENYYNTKLPEKAQTSFQIIDTETFTELKSQGGMFYMSNEFGDKEGSQVYRLFLDDDKNLVREVVSKDVHHYVLYTQK